MPTYEYACSTCGHRFDVRQSFADDPLTDCPQCGATVRRVIYPSGVIFKGTGWYKTDSRKDSASHSADTKKSPADAPAATSGDSDTSSTETKTTGKPKDNTAEKVSSAADD